MGLSSWLRDVKQLVLLYVTAGLTFAIWGAVYAVLRLSYGWTRPAVTLALLGCGTVTALFVWQHVEKRLIGTATPTNSPPEVQVTMAYGSGDTIGVIVLSATAPIAISPTYTAVFIAAPLSSERLLQALRVSSMEKFEPVARNAPRQSQVLVLNEA